MPYGDKQTGDCPPFVHHVTLTEPDPRKRDLIKPVVTKETYQRKADEYEEKMNLHCPFPHWRFDESLEAFVEVSDSRDQRFNDI